MNAHAAAALELALRLYRAPQLAQALRNDPLPEAGVDRVIRCASGEEAALVEASAQLNTSREVLREAAAFYLTQTLFARDADAWRVLGVRPGASQDVLRAHFRLLVHWLATSRNRDPLYALYGDRVQRAWTELRRSPEEIAARAQRRPPPAILPPRRERIRLGVEHYGARVLRLLRTLPTWAVGSVAGALLLVLLVTYWFTQAGVSPASFAADNAASPAAPLAAVTAKPAHSGTRVPPPPVVRQVSLMPARHASGSASSVVAAPVPAVSFVPPVAAGSSVVAAYNPAAAASATEALARVAAAAAARGRTSPGPQAATTSAVAAPARAAETQTPASAASQVAARDASVPRAAVMPPASVEPVIEAPAVAATAPVAPGAAVRALLQRFVSTYESADLDGFMKLFAPDARENRGGIAAIREDYGQLFAGSDLRRLQLYDLRIVPAAHAMIDVRVRYRAGVLMHGAASMADYSGGLHLLLRPDPQGLRIIQLLRGDEVEIKPRSAP
jgi:hypothetical protein